MPYPPTPSLALPATAAGAPVYELSSWVRRVGASIIDGLVVGVVTVPLTFAIGIALGHGPFDVDPDASFLATVFDPFDIALGFAVAILAALFYPSILMAKTDGRTLGKRATNIRVVRESGEVITYGYALKRELLVKGMLFGMFGRYLVIPSVLNYLWPLWDSQNRALHDMIVHSRVVRDYPSQSPAPQVPSTGLQF